MKLELHLLIADTDAGNHVEIFLSAEALRARQRKLILADPEVDTELAGRLRQMLEVVHSCPSPGESVTPCCGRPVLELPRTDRLTDTTRAVTCGTDRDLFPEAWDLWREDQGFGNDWYSTDQQTIEVDPFTPMPAAITDLINALDNTRPWLGKVAADHDQNEVGARAKNMLLFVEATLKRTYEYFQLTH